MQVRYCLKLSGNWKSSSLHKIFHLLIALFFSQTSFAEIPISMDGMMYKLATEQNDAAAQYFIGRNYLLGKTVKIDKREAAKWFAKAAEQEYPKAQFELGKLYLQGDGVKQNFPVAFKLVSSAANKNIIDAQYTLATMHLKNINGFSKPNEAIKWLEKAISGNYTPALYTLGKLFYEGTVVSSDKKHGKELLEEAAEMGDPDAIDYLKSIHS